MYKHHEESIKNMIKYFKEKEEVIALIFGGSIAKGCEREDSDIDAMVVISDADYEKRAANNQTAESIDGYCTYQGGYFDIKYMTKEYLIAAADAGSEPTRNSFLKSQVLFSADDEIAGIVARIPVFQESEYEEKMLSFYSNLWLNYYYFWKSCPLDGYMKFHVIHEIVYSIYRMVLQENKVLFPSNRRLEEFITDLKNKPQNIVRLAAQLMKCADDESCDAFVESFLSWTSYEIPADVSKILSTYTSDFEQWWRRPRPLIGEW